MYMKAYLTFLRHSVVPVVSYFGVEPSDCRLMSNREHQHAGVIGLGPKDLSDTPYYMKHLCLRGVCGRYTTKRTTFKSSGSLLVQYKKPLIACL